MVIRGKSILLCSIILTKTMWSLFYAFKPTLNRFAFSSIGKFMVQIFSTFTFGILKTIIQKLPYISWTSTKIKANHFSESLSLWCFIITPLSFVNITKAPYNPIPITLLIHCASKKRNSIESISTSSLPPTHINVYFKNF